MGEEVGTMQIRVLGEIKKSKVPHMSKRKKEKKEK
jgi:hypothetical protein